MSSAPAGEKLAQFLRDAAKAERDAHHFLMEQKNDQAFEAYRQAAFFYNEIGNHEQAGHCFIKAGSCWGKHVGHQPLRKAADASESAGREFLRARNYDSAISGFTDAAFLYEKEGDAARYSACFYESKRAQSRREWAVFRQKEESYGVRLRALLRWLANTHNCFLWGYGEKPFRTFGVGCAVILISALAYHALGPVRTLDAGIRSIRFSESLYLSFVTFATVGYGDYLPVSWAARCFSIFESLSGIILTPLFLVALTRRYLRMS